MELLYFGHVLTLAFLLPPVRQYGGRFFYFFLVLACSGAASTILLLLLPVIGEYVNQNFSMIFFSHLVLLSLQYHSLSKKQTYLLGAFYTFLSIISFKILSYPEFFYYFILVHLIITIYLIQYTVEFMNTKLELKLFHAALIFYEISVIGKFITIILNLESGMYYFTLSNIFQIFIAIFFTFVREDKPSLSIKMNTRQETELSNQSVDFLIKNRFKD